MLPRPCCGKYCCQPRMLWSKVIESPAEAVPTRWLGANLNRAVPPAKWGRDVPGRLRPGQREAHVWSWKLNTMALHSKSKWLLRWNHFVNSVFRYGEVAAVCMGNVVI